MENENAKRPALPLVINFGPDDWEVCRGLTKRELISAIICSGKNGSPKEIAEHGIMVADELLKQLEQ